MIETRAAEAAAHWGGRPVRLLAHRENAVFEMALPGGARAALRLHRQGYQAPPAIRSELWWCAALAEAGVAVPAALPARDGALLVMLQDGSHASAIAWAEGDALGELGKPLAYPLPQALRLHRALGHLLRRMHDATDALTLPADFTRPHWDRAGLVGEAPFWGRFWEHPGADADQRALLLRARDFLDERLADAGAIGPIHADVLRENVLVQGGEALSMIDFDDSGIGFRLYDLGTAMSQNLYEPDPTALRDALMEGYGTADAAMVEAFTLARCCASVGWLMPRLAPEHPVHRSHLARFMLCAGRVLGG